MLFGPTSHYNYGLGKWTIEQFVRLMGGRTSAMLTPFYHTNDIPYQISLMEYYDSDYVHFNPKAFNLNTCI